MPTLNSKFVYTSEPGFIIGFHGCDQSLRDDVINQQKMLNASSREHEWLGHGIYFWQSNYDRALDFAMNPPDGRMIRQPAVLGAVICLANCLDLMDTRHINHVRDSYELLKRFTAQQEKVLPRNRNKKGATNILDKVVRELDCAVIEYLHTVMRSRDAKPFDSVRGVFVEGDPIYTDAGFYHKTHVQICIRNPNCIKGFFIPRQEIDLS